MSEPKSNETAFSQPCRIIIIGAGIGGIAAAIGLTQAGHEVVLLERLPGFPDMSAGLHLPPNACRALHQLGILQAVEEQSITLRDITLLSYSDGSTLRGLNLVPDMLENYKMPYLAVHRVTFHKCLEEKAKATGAKFEFGCKISSIDFKTTSVHLEDGRVFVGDLVIGSDGEASQCRSLLLGRPDPPHHFGHKIFSCEISAEAIKEHEELRDLVDSPNVPYWLGPGSLCLGSVNQSNGNFNLLGGIEESTTVKVQNYPEVSDMKELREYHRDWDPRLGKLLDLAPFALKWTLTTISDVYEWSHPEGNFTLLGDSAHAMTPYLAQGAAQCLEDAVVLSELLARMSRREQIPDILTIYEAIRKPRTLQLKRRSEAMRNVYCIHNGPAQVERDRQLREMEPYNDYVIPWMDPDYQKWMYTYDSVDEADAAWKRYQEGKWPATRGFWKLKSEE